MKLKYAAIVLTAISALMAASCAKGFTLGIRNGTDFYDDFNGTAVDDSVWQVGTWSEHKGQTSPDRCFVKDGYLNMQFINDNGTFLSSAIQSRSTFLYGRWEARLKCSSVPGVLNSFYTIDWGEGGSGTQQEIDIEFLTKSFGSGSGQVHYACHASGKTSFQTNPDVDLGFNPSDDFHVYAIDISPTRIQWLADGVVKKTFTYANPYPSITAPYQLKLNFWSQNGSKTWIGGPPPSGVTCTYLIDWIRFTAAD